MIGCMLSDRVQLRSYSEQDVFLRLCLPVINEGFKILEGGKLMSPKRLPVIVRMVLPYPKTGTNNHENGTAILTF